MKRFFLFSCFLLLVLFSHAQVERDFVYFDYNSYELTPAAKTTIDGMLKLVGDHKITKIELYGYTDSDGDPAANHLLAENRVNAVKQYFLAKGMSAGLFVTEAFGERNPARDNSTEEGKQKNRRVEIAITFDLGNEFIPVVEEPVVVPIVRKAGSTMRQVPLTNANVQVFKFSAKDEIEITGAKGTRIYFHPNSFRDKDGKAITSDLTFKLIEVYKRSEMINQQLSTVSNGKILESGGMIYLAAFDKNKPVDLRYGWTYEIEFPTDQKIPGMILFNGDTSGNAVNWQVQGSTGKPMFDYRDQYNQDQLNKYVFKSSSLGWINCDHFIGDKNLTSVFVDVDDTTGVQYCLVFKNINCVMNIGSRENGIEFLNVPEGDEATVLVFRKTETATWFATKDITISKNDREALVLEKLTEAEFQVRLKEFD